MVSTPRTIIDFVDRGTGDTPLCHKAREVHINGIPVLVAKDGIDIEYGPDVITAITLRLLPTEVHFIHQP